MKNWTKNVIQAAICTNLRGLNRIESFVHLALFRNNNTVEDGKTNEEKIDNTNAGR